MSLNDEKDMSIKPNSNRLSIRQQVSRRMTKRLTNNLIVIQKAE